MKRRLQMLIVFASMIVMVLALSVGPASAGPAPCSGDGSGEHFGQHHISDQAKDGKIGNGPLGEHIPGAHSGYSLCLGVHD